MKSVIKKEVKIKFFILTPLSFSNTTLIKYN